MNKPLQFLVVLFIAIASFNSTKAQYTMHTDLFDGGVSQGKSPQSGKNIIYSGTYLNEITNNEKTNSLGATLKMGIEDNKYTKILDFVGVTNGGNPWGSLITDNTYLYGMTTNGGSANLGTVFKIKISDNTYTKILDLTTATGSYPWGSLISDGEYLYGMTCDGGTKNYGTVFKIKINDNSFTKILDFDFFVKGGHPEGSLISDGTYLYGMTTGGGEYDLGVAFKIKISDNTYTKLLEFNSSNTGGKPRGSLISDGTYLYGMTQGGGANGSGTIFKIKISDNTFTKILDFFAPLNGSYPIGSLISDGIYLYGTTPYGGLFGSGSFFKIKISDNSYSKIFDFDSISKISPYNSLVSDGIYIYGMTSNRGSFECGMIFKIKISDSTYSKLLDFSGISNGCGGFGSLLFNGSNLYGMTTNGGAANLGTVFKFQMTSPEINVKQNSTNITNNGTYNFGSAKLGTSQSQIFTIENNGNDDLHLTGIPKVAVSGTGFNLTDDAPTTVSSGGAATFKVTFMANAVGDFNGAISIENDAVGDSPYTFTVKGTGIPATGFVELSDNSVKVYPNPARGTLTISGLSAFKESKDIQVFVIDMLGQTKLTKTFKNTINKTIIDISSLTDGAYFIHLQSDTEKIVKHVFKQ